ncbi:uncharacterized protein LOC128217516 [Mya arenaria]|uniref:uncharacterized protein LOC128217516 n=1 Tax=Mya arenaria TaxID=6604 RepID=UPI0022DEB14C|nr:uncharacterized protein LOC128217516 [Mya arenaria]
MLRVMLIAHLVISELHGPICAEKCLQLKDLDHVQLAPWSLMAEDESSSTTISVQYQGIMWQVDHWTLAVNLSWTGLAPESRGRKYLTGFTYTIDGPTANNEQITDGQTTDGQIAFVVLPLMSENDPAKNNCIILPHNHPDLNMALWRVDLGSCDCNFQPISCVKSCTVHRLSHRNVGLDACHVWLRQNKQRVRMYFRALLISREVVEFHIRAQNINPYSHVSVAVFDDAMVASVKPLVEHSVDRVVNGEFSVLTRLNSVRGTDFYAKVTMRCGQDHFLDYETDLTHRIHTTDYHDPGLS